MPTLVHPGRLIMGLLRKAASAFSYDYGIITEDEGSVITTEDETYYLVQEDAP